MWLGPCGVFMEYVAPAAAAAYAAAEDVHGEQMLDSAGKPLYVGQRAIDRIFGDCHMQGQVPLEAGVGFNVAVKWTRDGSAKPTSRRSEELTGVGLPPPGS